MKITKATKDALTALEQALSDLGGVIEPRRADEFTANEMAVMVGNVSISTIHRKLAGLCKNGAYSRRRLGVDFLYRKA